MTFIYGLIVGLAIGWVAGWLYAGGLQQAVDRATDPDSPITHEE